MMDFKRIENINDYQKRNKQNYEQLWSYSLLQSMFFKGFFYKQLAQLGPRNWLLVDVNTGVDGSNSLFWKTCMFKF